ncbi:hypothetical protein CTI14_72205, partial [Methylobacterium radiotolerans]
YAGGDGRNHAEIALRRETADLLLAFPPRWPSPAVALRRRRRSQSRRDRPAAGDGGPAPRLPAALAKPS